MCSLKSRFILLTCTLSLASACSSTDRREYTLQGQILSVSADHLEANIKHEEIKGFMAAMTMPYRVKDAAQFANLKPGDLITSTLVVVPNEAYLTDVKKVGEAPLEKPAGDPSPGASSGFELLKPGEAVPDATFVDQEGGTRELASFKGSPLLMTFIYTQCPMPTFCPLMDRHFKTIQDRTADDPALKNVRLVSMSFDPITDTPPVLKAHAQKLGADTRRWTFLTGDRDEIDKFAMRFGVSIARDLKDPINITHNLRTALVDSKGTLVKTYTGNEWSPDQVLADLKAVAASN
jgi:protein SCO1/2